MSKHFMTSQQTFTCSKSTRETFEADVVLMSLFFTLNNSPYHFRVTIANFKKKNVYLDSFI